jgi:hypothetical protein
MAGLFDWLEAINTGKSVEIDPHDPNPFKDYVPFQINNGLSQHLDTILLANEMNRKPWLSKELQFAFLKSAVTKKKRFGKWAKVEEPTNAEDIETVSQFYSVNPVRAAEYLKLLTPEQISQMRQASSKGGTDYKPRGKK